MDRTPQKIVHEKTDALQSRILVADDSLIARRMVRFALQGLQCEVSEVGDGLAAWEQLRSDDVSLLITDLYMPKMDGIELIRKLRSTMHGVDLPIILLTTATCEEQEREARQAGVSLFIRKPFQPEQLAELVRQVLS